MSIFSIIPFLANNKLKVSSAKIYLNLNNDEYEKSNKSDLQIEFN